jgi:hypothetical protein
MELIRRGEYVIATHFHNPPIPIRTSDWSACIDGDEEGLTGWGRTRLEAVENLLAKIANEEDE